MHLMTHCFTSAVIHTHTHTHTHTMKAPPVSICVCPNNISDAAASWDLLDGYWVVHTEEMSQKSHYSVSRMDHLCVCHASMKCVCVCVCVCRSVLICVYILLALQSTFIPMMSCILFKQMSGWDKDPYCNFVKMNLKNTVKHVDWVDAVNSSTLLHPPPPSDASWWISPWTVLETDVGFCTTAILISRGWKSNVW